MYDQDTLIPNETRKINENIGFGESPFFLGGKYAKNVVTFKASAFYIEHLSIANDSVEESCKGKKYRNENSTVCYNVDRYENP